MSEFPNPYLQRIRIVVYVNDISTVDKACETLILKSCQRFVCFIPYLKRKPIDKSMIKKIHIIMKCLLSTSFMPVL